MNFDNFVQIKICYILEFIEEEEEEEEKKQLVLCTHNEVSFQLFYSSK